MIKTLHHHLSAALSRAARSLDANRRRFLALGASGVSTFIAMPVLATPVLAVRRPSVEARAIRGYRESDHVRRYYATARL